MEKKSNLYHCSKKFVNLSLAKKKKKNSKWSLDKNNYETHEKEIFTQYKTQLF